jgi:GxxExxY protein
MTHSEQLINRTIMTYHYRLKYHYRKVYNPIIELAKEVYRNLSWGWHESVYREAFAHELLYNGYLCSQEIVKPILYKGKELSHVNARLDLLIEKGPIKMIIELKADGATRNTMIKADQQCKRYLSLTGLSYGMVINFPEREMRDIEFIPIYYKNSKNYRIDLNIHDKEKEIDIDIDIDKDKDKEEKKRSPVMNYIYNKDNRDKAKRENIEMKGCEVTGYLSKKWKNLEENEKTIWNSSR